MAEPCNVCPFCGGSDIAKHEDGTRFICQTCHSWFTAPEKVNTSPVYPPWKTFVPQKWEKAVIPPTHHKTPMREQVEQMNLGVKTDLRYGIDVPVVKPVFFTGHPINPNDLPAPDVVVKDGMAEEMPWSRKKRQTTPEADAAIRKTLEQMKESVKPTIPLEKDNCPRCGRYVSVEDDKLVDGQVCCRSCAKICAPEDLITDDDDYEWCI